jgi:hypothetical protein
MNTTPDGQFQTYTVESGAYIRQSFFGSDPRLAKIASTSPTTTCGACPAAVTTTARSTRRSWRP